MRMTSPPRGRTLALAAIIATGLASPAMAASEPSTRVVSCRSGSCLLVVGRRDSAASAVSINGHAVAVEGGRSWRVSLPVETVRDWSVPLARTITVAVADVGSPLATESEARLPIGLLGHAEDLAMLVISVK
jgi:hypothetical protein